MKLPTIDKVDVRGKRVILRVDFNVLFEGGERLEDLYRIERVLPTISLLKNKGARIVLLSHLSKGKGYSLFPVAEYLKKHSADLFNKAIFLDDKDIGLIKKKVETIKDGEIAIVENIRLYEGEEKNNDVFAKKLSELGEIYVNDAFSASHRPHASIIGIAKHLPSYFGPLFEKEVSSLLGAFAPRHPFLLILGGVKFESKIGVIDRFLNIADKIFIGGALANNFFRARGDDIGDSSFDGSVSVERYLGDKKIILPVDVRKKDNKILDIGPKTLDNLVEIIKKGKFILWNGPLGNIEEKGFDKSTKIVAETIADSGAKSIIGGGDTVAVINKMGLLDKFSFVSTGGSAMLEFLANGTLPGIEALKLK